MILVKKADKQDLATIFIMDENCSKNPNSGGIHLCDSTQAWLIWIESGLVYKAINDKNEILGVLVSLSLNDRGNCIHKLLISKRYSDLGVSDSLLSFFLEKADKREEKVYTIILPEDFATIDLYFSKGFTQQTIYPDYLGVNEDRLIMSRPIQWSDGYLNNSVNSTKCDSLLSKNTDARKQSAYLAHGNLFLKSMNFNNYRVR